MADQEHSIIPFVERRLDKLDDELQNYRTDTMAVIKALESRFTDHVQVYTENVKESKRVADALEKLEASVKKMIENSVASDAKVIAMHEKFVADAAVYAADGRRMKTVVLWGATIGAFGIIAALMRTILKMG